METPFLRLPVCSTVLLELDLLLDKYVTVVFSRFAMLKSGAFLGTEILAVFVSIASRPLGPRCYFFPIGGCNVTEVVYFQIESTCAGIDDVFAAYC